MRKHYSKAEIFYRKANMEGAMVSLVTL